MTINEAGVTTFHLNIIDSLFFSHSLSFVYTILSSALGINNILH